MVDGRRRKTGEPPSQIGEYRILRLLGRGRMGRVYLAQDTNLDRLVALKFIASVRPDAQARERFHLEGRALARLVHPNVVAIHRVDQVDGHPYLVAEYVRGQTLAEMPKPIRGELVLRIGIGIARGLAAAHRQGILHRDIKPANVMLGHENEVKLLDFGLAKMLEPTANTHPSSTVEDEDLPPSTTDSQDDDKPELTGAGGFVGTPMFMAPEVLRGASASRRSDIFAVGAVLYELCTGHPPRPLPSDDVSFDEWAAIAPKPLASHGHFDPRLAAAIDRCMREDPASRFASADELRDVLEEIDADETEGDVPEGNPYRGLSAFGAEHRAVFFGRAVEVRSVIDRLRAEPLVVVTGDSGVGKSSLCRAGVLPKIQDGVLGDGRRYTTVIMVPSDKPLVALADAITAIVGQDKETVRTDPIGSLQSFVRSMPRDQGFVLFVDQLEELHTLSNPDDAAVFGEFMAGLGVGASGARVLAAIRGDFFTRLASLPVLAESLPSALHLLRPLSPEATREAIVGPARRTGVRFGSEALVDELVDSASRTVGGLPLLQFALAELWQAQDPTSRCIPASALQAIGGVAGALARHADQLVASLASTEAREAARRIFMHLVTTEGTTARRSADEIDGDDASHTALETLVRGRLVVARVIDGKTFYELAHDALTRQWDTLRGWLDQDREARRARERIEAASVEWVRLGRTPELLLQEKQLSDIDRVGDMGLRRDQAEFLAVSRRMARRRRWEKRAIYAAIVAVVAIAVLGARWRASSELRRLVTLHEAEGRAAMADGEREKRSAEEQRQRAFARFDAAAGKRDDEARQCRDDAEKQWAAALESARKAESHFAMASRSWEAGLALDASRTNLRSLIADAYLLRIAIAESFYAHERRQELLDRVPFYDDDGSRRRILSAVPHLSIQTSPAGAEVDLERYEQVDGRMTSVPVGRLGTSPLQDVKVQRGPGSYRLVVRLSGHTTVNYPIVLGRGEESRISVELPARGAIAEGYVYIPAGRHLYGSDAPEVFRRFLANQPLHESLLPSFLIGRTEVTYAEWIRFLEDLSPEQRGERLPTVRNQQWGVELTQAEGGAWKLALTLNNERITAMAGQPFVIPGRTRRREQNWQKFPVTGISKIDADAFAAWLDRTGRLAGARLCTEREWERASRGADSRVYPHGNRLDPDDAAFDETYGRQTSAFGPDEVDAHPVSESPFGVLGTTGSVHEWTLSTDNQNELIFRGGAWYFERTSVRLDNRFFGEPNTRDHMVGLRICATFPPR